MAVEIRVSVPEDYYDFLDDEGYSPSAILQSGIEERAERAGVDLDGY